MKSCVNCVHSYYVGITPKCSINRKTIPHPYLMGGKKCGCYEKYVKDKFSYPSKEDLRKHGKEQ